MRRLILISLLCLLPSLALATTRTVGTGKDYTVMATCFAALANGDTIESYGPYSESNQTLAPPAGVTGVTWVHYGADYTFDGTGATAAFLTLAATNTGWTIDVLDQDGGGRVKVTGYIGVNPLVVTGASNVVGGFRLTANGAAGVAQVTAILTGNSSEFHDILIDNPVDPTNQHWRGIYLDGGTGYVVQDCTVEDVTITGATFDAYGVSMAQATTAPIVRDLVVRRMASADRVHGLYAIGANGYATVDGATFYALAGANRSYGFLSLDRTVIIQNVLGYGLGGAVARTIYVGGVQVDAVAPDSTIQNCTAIGGDQGFTFQSVPAAGTRTVQNCISSGGTVEFHADLNAVATSKSNCAANGDYSAHFPNGATDLSTDPLFQDAANDDYRLSRGSPCVDTGLWIDGHTRDIERQPISGPGMDRGAFEFSQVGGRDTRTQLTQTPVVVTRSAHSTHR